MAREVSAVNLEKYFKFKNINSTKLNTKLEKLDTKHLLWNEQISL